MLLPKSLPGRGRRGGRGGAGAGSRFDHGPCAIAPACLKRWALGGPGSCLGPRPDPGEAGQSAGRTMCSGKGTCASLARQPSILNATEFARPMARWAAAQGRCCSLQSARGRTMNARPSGDRIEHHAQWRQIGPDFAARSALRLRHQTWLNLQPTPAGDAASASDPSTTQICICSRRSGPLRSANHPPGEG